MQTSAVPEELIKLREQIDSLDEELLNVLSRRFQVTAEVGLLKAEHGLESVDEAREAKKLRHLQQASAGKNLNPDFVHDLFQMIFAEVVNNHRSYRK